MFNSRSLRLPSCCFMCVVLSLNLLQKFAGMDELFDFYISFFILSGQLRHSLMSHWTMLWGWLMGWQHYYWQYCQGTLLFLKVFMVGSFAQHFVVLGFHAGWKSKFWSSFPLPLCFKIEKIYRLSGYAWQMCYFSLLNFQVCPKWQKILLLFS